MPIKLAKCEAPAPSPEAALTRRFCDCDMSVPETHDFLDGRAAVFSSRCPSKKSSNEDAAVLIGFNGRSGILAVADGVGGSRGAELASRLVIESLIESFQKEVHFSESNPFGKAEVDSITSRMAILNGIEDANQKLLNQGQGSATTLAVAEIQGTTVRPYHVGDSMVIVFGQRRKIKMQTVSHSPVGFAVEAGLLNEADAMHHKDRHFVSNVIGTAEMRIEIGSPLHLAPRDTLLLASDGLFDNLHIDEIIDRSRIGPLDAAMRRLAEDSTHRMTHPGGGHPSKPDDLTIVSYRLNTRRRS